MYSPFVRNLVSSLRVIRWSGPYVKMYLERWEHKAELEAHIASVLKIDHAYIDQVRYYYSFEWEDLFGGLDESDDD